MFFVVLLFFLLLRVFCVLLLPVCLSEGFWGVVSSPKVGTLGGSLVMFPFCLFCYRREGKEERKKGKRDTRETQERHRRWKQSKK
jgi:hypothetical protein